MFEIEDQTKSSFKSLENYLFSIEKYLILIFFFLQSIITLQLEGGYCFGQVWAKNLTSMRI